MTAATLTERSAMAELSTYDFDWRPPGVSGAASDWARISPLFDDTPEMARLRRASCLLADVAWQANPNFRADRGVEMAREGVERLVVVVVGVEGLDAERIHQRLQDWNAF